MDGIREWRREDGFVISTDPGRVDYDFTVAVLRETYWGRDQDPAVLRASLRRAEPFGLYDPEGRQVGFARVVSDGARFGWLSDVFVLEELRGRGLGKWLVGTIVACPPYDRLQNFMLATHDAHGLYRQHGFAALDHPDRFMLRSGG